MDASHPTASTLWIAPVASGGIPRAAEVTGTACDLGWRWATAPHTHTQSRRSSVGHVRDRRRGQARARLGEVQVGQRLRPLLQFGDHTGKEILMSVKPVAHHFLEFGRAFDPVLVTYELRWAGLCAKLSSYFIDTMRSP